MKNITESLYDKLENAVIRIYEGLYRQVKESNETEETSIDDIEQKIDIIMDALGLENPDEEVETKEVEVSVENTDNAEEDNDVLVEDINFVDSDATENVEEA